MPGSSHEVMLLLMWLAIEPLSMNVLDASLHGIATRKASPRIRDLHGNLKGVQDVLCHCHCQYSTRPLPNSIEALPEGLSMLGLLWQKQQQEQR